MKRTILVLLMAGACSTILAAEPRPATASSPASSASGAAARLDPLGDVPGWPCETGVATTTELEGWPGLGPGQASSAVKCSKTVCSPTLRCCVGYGCIGGRCLID